jgi:uncharacterized membrane protein
VFGAVRFDKANIVVRPSQHSVAHYPNLAVAGAMALIEPLANGAARLIFDRWWSRSRHGGSSMAVAPVV